jgi:hypothetical protein
LKIAHHLLSHPEQSYRDLGADYYETRSKERLAKQLVGRLQRLGYLVTIDTAAV